MWTEDIVFLGEKSFEEKIKNNTIFHIQLTMCRPKLCCELKLCLLHTYNENDNPMSTYVCYWMVWKCTCCINDHSERHKTTENCLWKRCPSALKREMLKMLLAIALSTLFTKSFCSILFGSVDLWGSKASATHPTTQTVSSLVSLLDLHLCHYKYIYLDTPKDLIEIL